MTTLPLELLKGLQEDLTRKTYSFTEYILMCSPYVPAGREPLMELLARLVEEEHRHARAIGGMIVLLEGIPNPGLFDESAADMNYLDIVYLYGLLIRHKEKTIVHFAERLRQAEGFPPVLEGLGRIMEDEKRQLDDLKGALERTAAGGATVAGGAAPQAG